MALPPLSPEARHLRAGYARARRFHPDAPETEALGLKFRASRLADHIREQIEKCPPLTTEQREELARILRPAGPSPVLHMPAPGDLMAELVQATLAPPLDGDPDEWAPDEWAPDEYREDVVA